MHACLPWCMCELFCVAGLNIYSGCRHDPQSLVCLASSLSVVGVDGGRWCQVGT